MYRGLGFLALLWWFGFSHTPYPPKSPVSMLDRRQAGRLRKSDNLLTGKGGGRGAESHDRKKTESSVNPSILSGGRSTTGRVPGTRADHGQPNTLGVRVRKKGGCRIGAVIWGEVYSKEVQTLLPAQASTPVFFSSSFQIRYHCSQKSKFLHYKKVIVFLQCKCQSSPKVLMS
jgi:hypothetical protein